jgi:putative transposase
MSLKSRRYPRLKNKELYSMPGTIAHIIIGTDKKRPYFANHKYADAFTQLIIKTAQEKDINLYAYCIMTDHIHILIASSMDCSITDYVRLIKGRFTKYCRDAGLDIDFQRSFYDHLLRKEEDIEEVARYIIGNPVRAGIGSKFGEYPFAGSMVFKINS